MNLTYHRILADGFVPRYEVRQGGRLAGMIMRPKSRGEWLFRGQYNLGSEDLREIAGEMDELRVKHDKRVRTLAPT